MLCLFNLYPLNSYKKKSYRFYKVLEIKNGTLVLRASNEVLNFQA
jgi:hypothetical protein